MPLIKSVDVIPQVVPSHTALRLTLCTSASDAYTYTPSTPKPLSKLRPEYYAEPDCPYQRSIQRAFTHMDFAFAENAPQLQAALEAGDSDKSIHLWSLTVEKAHVQSHICSCVQCAQRHAPQYPDDAHPLTTSNSTPTKAALIPPSNALPSTQGHHTHIPTPSEFAKQLLHGCLGPRS